MGDIYEILYSGKAKQYITNIFGKHNVKLRI